MKGGELGHIIIRQKPSEKRVREMLKKFWKDVAEMLPEGYMLKPKFSVLGIPIGYEFMNVYKKGLKAKLGLTKPLMTLWVNMEMKVFDVECSSGQLPIIEPAIQTLRELGYWIFINKIEG